MADHQELLSNFMAITGQDDSAAAIAVLEATDWNLEQAIELHFASGGVNDAGPRAAGRAGASSEPGFDIPQEEEVRAPMPTKIERLYGDAPSDLTRARVAMQQVGMNYGLQSFGLQPRPQRPPPQIETFRNFKAESAGTAAGASTAAGTAQDKNPLHDMFRPPERLLYKGDIRTAAQVAGSEGKWLLINVQSEREFASLQLNRDTFSQSMLQDVIQGMFLFIQVMDSSESGRTAVSQYRLSQLPSIMVVDPISGAKLYERTGFVDAEKLMEDLVPFMDVGPQDPRAAQLAQQMSMKRRPAGSGSGSGVARGSGSGSGAAAAGKGQGGPLTEDEQLAMAIAMSMEQGGTGAQVANQSEDNGYESEDDEDDQGMGGDEGDDADAAEEAAIWEEIRKQKEAQELAAARPTQEQEVAEARARLPPEPGESEAGSCRVAVRMPTGERLQRRFMGTDKVQALHDWVMLSSSDATAGKAFALSEARPGAQTLTDMDQTLAEAHVQNAMLVAKWL